MALPSVALLVGLMAQPAPMKTNAVQPLPDKPPAWLDGYRLRWPLRVVGDPVKQPGKSVITSLATGGWLRPDASDLAVQTPEGEVLPVTVLLLRAQVRSGRLWVAAAYFGTNYAEMGQFRPAYAEFGQAGGGWYDYPGSYWKPLKEGEVRNGIDFARFFSSFRPISFWP